MNKSIDRTTGDESKSHHKDSDAIIKKEIAALLKKNASDHRLNDHKVIAELRSKYSDKDLVHSIFEAYKDRLSYIQKKSKKFKQLMLSHYSDRNFNQGELIKKAKKYQGKLSLSDAEFNMFINLVLSDKNIEDDVYSLPSTKMAKTLGFSQTVVSAETLNVGVDEENVVQDILRMFGETKALHAQVVLQSLEYTNCDPIALRGEYCKSKNNFYSYVHPVIAALFIPKITLFDEHMLIANLGYIVHSKKHGLPIMTQPDVELYYDMIRDPNEHVCDSDSAIKDIKNRYFLQTKLWDSVLNLRQGKYYQDGLSDFLVAIDQCKSNIYDAPDLTYVKDEGAILRRLLAAFSLRPTWVATTRLWGTLGPNPYNMSANPLGAMGVSRLTTVPMATLRLPLNASNPSCTNLGSGAVAIGNSAPVVPAVKLTEALSQPQWFVENKMIVPKRQDIVHSNGVLIFYVGRKFKSINVTRLNAPCAFDTLPMTVAGWERLNTTPIDVDTFLCLQSGENFVLRSVVVIDAPDAANKLITGCSTYIFCPDIEGIPCDPKTDINVSAAVQNAQNAPIFHYQPQAAGMAAARGAPIPPVSPIVAGGVQGATRDNVIGKIRTHGTIFVYDKVNRKTWGNFISA